MLTIPVCRNTLLSQQGTLKIVGALGQLHGCATRPEHGARMSKYFAPVPWAMTAWMVLFASSINLRSRVRLASSLECGIHEGTLQSRPPDGSLDSLLGSRCMHLIGGINACKTSGASFAHAFPLRAVVTTLASIQYLVPYILPCGMADAFHFAHEHSASGDCCTTLSVPPPPPELPLPPPEIVAPAFPALMNRRPRRVRAGEANALPHGMPAMPRGIVRAGTHSRAGTGGSPILFSFLLRELESVHKANMLDGLPRGLVDSCKI